MTKRHGQVGRPRSEHARAAVLHAVDDQLLEVGYAAMTMKGIAERAGVSRQTVYRWWSTKAEILLEASAIDAEQELAVEPTGRTLDDLTAYVEALVTFLSHSPAGAAYRALLGEAQHDFAVAELLAGKDVLGNSAQSILEGITRDSTPSIPIGEATALLIGPAFFWVLSGRDPAQLEPRELAKSFLRELHARELR